MRLGHKAFLLTATWMALTLCAMVAILGAQDASVPAAAAPAEPPSATPATAPAAPAETPATAPATGPAEATAAEVLATAGERPRDEKLALLWENLLHYVNMAQGEAARSFAQAIMEFNAKPSEVYMLSVAQPGSLADLTRGRSLPGMKGLIDDLVKLIEEGYKAERSDPEQIRNSIELLGGTTRAYLRGRDRLLVSGEYAVPQLLRKLDESETPVALRERIMLVLPRIGREAVLPLSAALQTKNPQLQQAIATVLGMIEYPHAVPPLKELYDRKDLDEAVRRAVRGALVACAGDVNVLNKPVAQLYYDLAVKFYYRAESLRPDERSQTANVWYWDEAHGGLIFKPVPREILCDIYAMRAARAALRHDPAMYPAVSLWLAANLKREANLPAGATDPTYPATNPPARFFVLSAGAKYQQDVLARALRDRDWAVAIGAIEALGRTAGAASLVEPVSGGAQPLVEALTSSNREVRYWAAISLATALPKRRFTGDELVIPALGEAVRQTGKRVALVVAAEAEQRNALKDAARAAGYEVIDEADCAKGLAAARAAGGADVAILASEPDALAGTTMLRRDPLLVTLPVVIAAQTERYLNLAKADPRVRLVSPTAKAGEVSEAIADVVKSTAGTPITPEGATQWAVRAAEAIRLLGLTNTPVYDVTKARPALIGALGDPRAEVRVAAAQALAAINGPEAQQAIAGLALDSAADEKLRLAAFASLGEAVRRFGNSLTDKQAEAIVTIVASGTGAIRDSAAEILGALSLPSDKIKDLILQTDAGK